MVQQRYSLCLSLVLLLAWSEMAPAQKLHREQNQPSPRVGLITRIVHLLPSAWAEEMHLDAQQQQQIRKLEQEFDQKRQQILFKTAAHVVGIVQSLQKEEQREAAPVLAIVHDITGGLLDARRIRVAYDKKLLAVLNEEQKEQYLELKERGPEQRRERRLARQAVRGGTVETGPWLLFSTETQRQLHLTPEQKQKLTALRQEMEQKLQDVLTQEQQKRFEELEGSGGRKKRSVLEQD
jgi:hypothetical protein